MATTAEASISRSPSARHAVFVVANDLVGAAWVDVGQRRAVLGDPIQPLGDAAPPGAPSPFPFKSLLECRGNELSKGLACQRGHLAREPIGLLALDA